MSVTTAPGAILSVYLDYHYTVRVNESGKLF